MDIVSALRSFIRVSEVGSFSAAAADLEITQPSVSRQVSSLESHLDVRLFQRTTAGLSLTVEGQRLLTKAMAIVESINELTEEAANDRGSVRGKVRVAVPSALGLVVSDRIQDLLAEHPKLSVEVICKEKPSDLIEEGLDLDIRVGGIGDSNLICRKIGCTTAHLVAAPSYLSRRGTPVSLEDLARHDCIWSARGGDERYWSFLDGTGITAVKVTPRLVLDSAVSVHRAALAGAGIALLSHILADADVAAGRLVAVMTSTPLARLPIHAVYPSKRSIPLRVKVVLEFLTRVVEMDPSMRSD
jgi:DNA-binding transcriptional LysR family regulator